jgi:hypothetical protein
VVVQIVIAVIFILILMVVSFADHMLVLFDTYGVASMDENTVEVGLKSMLGHEGWCLCFTPFTVFVADGN